MCLFKIFLSRLDEIFVTIKTTFHSTPSILLEQINNQINCIFRLPNSLKPITENYKLTYQEWIPDDHKRCYGKTTENFWLLLCVMFESSIIMLYISIALYLPLCMKNFWINATKLSFEQFIHGDSQKNVEKFLS
jgi:hypothetical protein